MKSHRPPSDIPKSTDKPLNLSKKSEIWLNDTKVKHNLKSKEYSSLNNIIQPTSKNIQNKVLKLQTLSQEFTRDLKLPPPPPLILKPSLRFRSETKFRAISKFQNTNGNSNLPPPPPLIRMPTLRLISQIKITNNNTNLLRSACSSRSDVIRNSRFENSNSVSEKTNFTDVSLKSSAISNNLQSTPSKNNSVLHSKFNYSYKNTYQNKDIPLKKRKI